jgi:hypothetical protein
VGGIVSWEVWKDPLFGKLSGIRCIRSSSPLLDTEYPILDWNSSFEADEDAGLVLGCWPSSALVFGTALIEVITDTSLGQSVVSVRQLCSMLGVLLPAKPTMARYAEFSPGEQLLSREDTGEAREE